MSVKFKPRVLMTNYYDRKVVASPLAQLRGFADVIDGNCNRNFTVSEICEALPGIHAVIAADEPYSRDVFDHAPELLLVARDGAGYDKIDLEAATELGIVVTRAPVVIDATANLTLGLMIALVRQIPLADRAVRENRWLDRRAFLCPDLTGMTIGIVGFGLVGRQVAIRAAAFGMNICAFDNVDISAAAAPLGVQAVSLERLLAESDIVSVHLRHTPETRNFFSAPRFDQMKKGSFFLNTSRGEIVNESDLTHALQSGHLAGAALDVLQKEPVDPAHPLLTLPNVLFSPHLAGDTTTTMIQATEMNVAQIHDLFSGKLPSHVLNPEVWPKARIHSYLKP